MLVIRLLSIVPPFDIETETLKPTLLLWWLAPCQILLIQALEKAEGQQRRVFAIPGTITSSMTLYPQLPPTFGTSRTASSRPLEVLAPLPQKSESQL